MIDGGKVLDEVEMGSERGFAFVFTGFFAIVGCWPLIHGNTPRVWMVGIATLFFILGLWQPSVLRPFNVLWFRFSLMLAKVVTPIIMGLLYVTTIVPTGLILRVRRKDLLGLLPSRDRPSYWIIRQPPGPPTGSMKRQF